MSEMALDGRGIPRDILEILTMKSTKKASTKFPAKIAALLTWVGDDEERQEMAGIKMGNGRRILIKRGVLAAAFQIQNDSLMLNMKRNEFVIVGNDRQWSICSLPADFRADICVTREKAPRSKAVLVAGTQLMPPNTSFQERARERWVVITDGVDTKRMTTDMFFMRVIDVFGIRGLTKADMFAMLSFIVLTTIPGFVYFGDFVQLFANFGEKNALFPKIIALMRATSDCPGSLVRECIEGRLVPSATMSTRIAFSSGASFGFAISFSDGRTLHVRNDFTVPFFSEFLIDEHGTRYNSWKSVLSR